MEGFEPNKEIKIPEGAIYIHRPSNQTEAVVYVFRENNWWAKGGKKTEIMVAKDVQSVVSELYLKSKEKKG